jgi:hypothetical protein
MESDTFITTTTAPAAIGSELFAAVSLLVISAVVLLILRHYLVLRNTPGYLLVPVFLALFLPASIVLLVPIDLASHAKYNPEGDDGFVGSRGGRGIWLPERVLLVGWRITYWLTFVLTWFILPILAEYSDSGYRDPVGKLKYSLHSNGRYQAIVFGTGGLALIYVFVSYGVKLESLKGVLMAVAYCWGLILAIYLMGHGLVALPRKLFRNASISGRLRRIQVHAPKVHERMEDAFHVLEDLEAEVAQLSQRKTGSAKEFREWIEDLADTANLPESRPRTLSRRLSQPSVRIPHVVTEQYLAELTRKLDRARHARLRWIDEWDRLVQDAVATEQILDSAASKKLEIGRSSPSASFLERFTVFTPYTRYIYYYHIVPCFRIVLGVFLSLASACIIWSELVKSAAEKLSIIRLTVVHHPNSEKGQIGFPGQMIAAAWIVYMCAAALTSLTEVRVWRGRALVRRNTASESACWYAMQVAKLTVPLSYNFMTFLSRSIYKSTKFYDFLGKLINLTPLGAWFDYLFPMFILVPVCATLFNLYGRAKRWFGFADVIDGEEDDDLNGYGTGSWREGRDLIERELGGAGALAHLRDGVNSPRALASPPNGRVSRAPNRLAPEGTSSPLVSSSPVRSPARTGTDRTIGGAPGQQHQPLRPPARAPEEENFLEGFAHRVKNTLDTMPTPKWMQEGIKKPRWMTGAGEEVGSSSRPSLGGGGGSNRTASGRILSMFGGRGGEGNVRI